MKTTLRFLIIFLFLFIGQDHYAQDMDDVFGQLEAQEELPLLPEKMLFTQRMLWGEKGLLRQANLAPLNPLQRNKEIKIRRTMLVTHQVLGYITLGSMIAQGIIGGKLYNGDTGLKSTHETMAGIVNFSYFSGAALSLFAPQPLTNNTRKGLSSARAHKWLATIHLSAMVATNYFAEKDRVTHRLAAYTAFASFATAALILTF